VVNQPREKIGVMFGSPETTPGGRGKDFAYTTRIQTKRGSWIEIKTGPGKDDKEEVGQEIKATAIKNKSAKPHRSATWDFYFDNVADPETGDIIHAAGSYDIYKEILDIGVAFGVIRVAGAMYYFEDYSFRGRDGFIAAMRENEKFRTVLSEEVMFRVTAHKPVAAPKKAPAKKAAARAS
jgi:recombination protein RecA